MGTEPTGLLDAKIYDWDLPLFRDLGLNALADINTREWVDLGTATEAGEDYRVRVSVLALPAQFWRFDIMPSEGNPCVIETGSGSLKTFWPFIREIANGMVVVRSVSPAPSPSEDPRP